jgi:hypothetical protein
LLQLRVFLIPRHPSLDQIGLMLRDIHTLFRRFGDGMVGGGISKPMRGDKGFS